MSQVGDDRLREIMHSIQEASERGSNTGHGHVFKRPDGMRARCGGPGLCAACSSDKVLRDRALPGYEETLEIILELLAKRASEQSK